MTLETGLVAPSMPLTTLVRVLDLVGIKPGVATYNGFLRRRIAAVSAVAEQRADRGFRRQVREQVFSPDRFGSGRVFPLWAWPVSDPANTARVWSDPDGQFDDDSEILLDETTKLGDWSIEPERGKLIVAAHAIYQGPGTLKVRYTGGLSESLDLLEVDVASVVGTPLVWHLVEGLTGGAVGTVVAYTAAGGGNPAKLTIRVTEGSFLIGETLQINGGGSGISATLSAYVPGKVPLLMLAPELVARVEQQVQYEYERRSRQGAESVSLQAGSRSYQGELGILEEVDRVFASFSRTGA